MSAVKIRRESSYFPVYIVSAGTDEFDKILLLEREADDYLMKPFSRRELLARVRTAIRPSRRRILVVPDQIHFGVASIDFARMRACVSGSPVHLTVCEFKILKFLVQNVDRVVYRSEIAEVFGRDGSCESRSADNIILRLRRKLERDRANPVHILTVRGVGYMFVP